MPPTTEERTRQLGPQRAWVHSEGWSELTSDIWVLLLEAHPGEVLRDVQNRQRVTATPIDRSVSLASVRGNTGGTYSETCKLDSPLIIALLLSPRRRPRCLPAASRVDETRVPSGPAFQEAGRSPTKHRANVARFCPLNVSDKDAAEARR